MSNWHGHITIPSTDKVLYPSRWRNAIYLLLRSQTSSICLLFFFFLVIFTVWWHGCENRTPLPLLIVSSDAVHQSRRLLIAVGVFLCMARWPKRVKTKNKNPLNCLTYIEMSQGVQQSQAHSLWSQSKWNAPNASQSRFPQDEKVIRCTHGGIRKQNVRNATHAKVLKNEKTPRSRWLWFT